MCVQGDSKLRNPGARTTGQQTNLVSLKYWFSRLQIPLLSTCRKGKKKLIKIYN
jgi:hypothetical protein